MPPPGAPSLSVLCPVSGLPGSDPRRGDLLCGPAGPDAPGSEGAPLAVSMLGGVKNRVLGERGAGRLREWRGPPVSPGYPRSRSVSAPRAGELSLPLPSLFGRCQSGAAATAERLAVRGVGKAGGLCESYGKNFPPLGTAKLTFLQRSSWFYSLSRGAIDLKKRESLLPIFFSRFSEPLLW